MWVFFHRAAQVDDEIQYSQDGICSDSCSASDCSCSLSPRTPFDLAFTPPTIPPILNTVYPSPFMRNSTVKAFGHGNQFKLIPKSGQHHLNPSPPSWEHENLAFHPIQQPFMFNQMSSSHLPSLAQSHGSPYLRQQQQQQQQQLQHQQKQNLHYHEENQFSFSTSLPSNISKQPVVPGTNFQLHPLQAVWPARRSSVQHFPLGHASQPGLHKKVHISRPTFQTSTPILPSLKYSRPQESSLLIRPPESTTLFFNSKPRSVPIVSNAHVTGSDSEMEKAVLRNRHVLKTKYAQNLCSISNETNKNTYIENAIKQSNNIKNSTTTGKPISNTNNNYNFNDNTGTGKARAYKYSDRFLRKTFKSDGALKNNLGRRQLFNEEMEKGNSISETQFPSGWYQGTANLSRAMSDPSGLSTARQGVDFLQNSNVPWIGLEPLPLQQTGTSGAKINETLTASKSQAQMHQCWKQKQASALNQPSTLNDSTVQIKTKVTPGKYVLDKCVSQDELSTMVEQETQIQLQHNLTKANSIACQLSGQDTSGSIWNACERSETGSEVTGGDRETGRKEQDEGNEHAKKNVTERHLEYFGGNESNWDAGKSKIGIGDMGEGGEGWQEWAGQFGSFLQLLNDPDNALSSQPIQQTSSVKNVNVSGHTKIATFSDPLSLNTPTFTDPVTSVALIGQSTKPMNFASPTSDFPITPFVPDFPLTLGDGFTSLIPSTINCAAVQPATDMPQSHAKLRSTASHLHPKIDSDGIENASTNGICGNKDDRRHKCPYCNVACTNHGQLKGHLRVHTG